MTKSMALDMGRDKIRVNSVAPSWTWTPEVAKIDPEGTQAFSLMSLCVLTT